MIFPLTLRRVCVVHQKVDFRKGFNGLLGEAYKLNLSPYKGDIIIFTGCQKKRIKILLADITGLWVLSKIFHNGIVPKEFSFLKDRHVSEIDLAAVELLIEGAKTR